MTTREKFITALVLTAIAALFLTALGSVGFWDHDEGRYAAIPAAMLHTGDWLTPRLCGVPYFEKPPLLYWVTALSFKVFGFTEFAGRLPVAICGFIGICAILLLGWRRFDWQTGLLAAVVLALSPEYFVSARFLVTDMLLTCFLTLALVSFYLASTSENKRGYLLFYVFIALATMSKGIIGFLLPALIIGSYVLLTRQWRILLEMKLWLGVLVFAVIVFPWFILEQRRYPEFLHFFIVQQHFQRFASAHAEHGRSPLFFVPVLLVGFFPWVMFLPSAAQRDLKLVGWFGKLAKLAEANPSQPQPAPARLKAALRAINHQSSSLIFLWLWFGIIFAFFSVSHGKLVSYILPAFPPIALLAAQVWTQYWGKSEDKSLARGVGWGTLLAGLVMALVALVVLLYLPSHLRREGRVQFEAVQGLAAALGVTMAGGAVGLFYLTWRQQRRPLCGLFSGVNALTLLLVVGAAKTIEPYVNLKPMAVRLAQRLQPDDQIVLYNIAQPSLEFYTRRLPIVIGEPGELTFGVHLEAQPTRFFNETDGLKYLRTSPKTVYCIASVKDFPELQRRLGASAEVMMKNANRVVFRHRVVQRGE